MCKHYLKIFPFYQNQFVKIPHATNFLQLDDLQMNHLGQFHFRGELFYDLLLLCVYQYDRRDISFQLHYILYANQDILCPMDCPTALCVPLEILSIMQSLRDDVFLHQYRFLHQPIYLKLPFHQASRMKERWLYRSKCLYLFHRHILFLLKFLQKQLFQVLRLLLGRYVLGEIYSVF